uniref:hypothetical protein n=1 Tax=Clostridium sp. NkU-1 TaxID=1095009 RepID=UPI000AB5B4EC
MVKPVFSVCQTKDGEAFRDPYFKGVCVVLVMLVPKDDHEAENSDILGVLSERLIEEEEFLEAVRHGGKEEIRALVSQYLNQYFKHYLDKI